jgi:hypothetical protein
LEGSWSSRRECSMAATTKPRLQSRWALGPDAPPGMFTDRQGAVWGGEGETHL